MDEFDYNRFILENKGKKFIKPEKYPKGLDKFDECIFDLFLELNITEKSLSTAVFEKIVMRNFIELSTNKTFMERIKHLNEIGIPIELFPEQTIAMKIGYKKNKSA